MTNKFRMDFDDDCSDIAVCTQIEDEVRKEMKILDGVYDRLINKNIILVNEGITANSIEKIAIPLLEMESDPECDKITVYVNTNGGSVFDGLPICNIIENLKTPTEIIVLGYAYSMGSLILMAGKNNPNVVRKCYPFSTSLIHGGSIEIAGSSSQVKDFLKFNEKWNERINKFIKEHTNMSEDEYACMDRYEIYLDSDDMIEKGLVDEIIC